MFIKKITAIILMFFLTFAAVPFYAVASALEDTSSGVNVLNLPTPVITNIDAKNSIVQLKADGYINDNASLLATVALVNENGDVVDVAEKKVSDPENIRISLRVGKIQVGDNIFAKFTNHGIEGDGSDLIHETQEPTEEPGTTAPPTIIIDRGKGSSSVTYIVTEAEPEQIVIEKLVEAEPIPAIDIIRNVPVYVYAGPENAQGGEESADVDAPEIKAEDMVTLGEMIENTKTEPGSEIIKPVSANIKIILSLLIILSLFLIVLTIFVVRYYLSKPFSEVRQASGVFDFSRKTKDKFSA